MHNGDKFEFKNVVIQLKASGEKAGRLFIVPVNTSIVKCDTGGVKVAIEGRYVADYYRKRQI